MSDIEHEHLTEEALERYFKKTQTEEASRLFLHLLAVCPKCREAGGAILEAYRAGAVGIRFSSVDIDLFRSRKEAPDLWQELKGLPLADQLRSVSTDRRFVAWGLAELLAKESSAAGVKDPAQAVELASLAVEIAKRLREWEPCEKEWLFELRAYVHAYLASAHRIAGSLRDAERVQRRSDGWWREGAESMGDIFGYEPEILSLKASLRKDQRRFDEALGLADTVIGIYLAGEPATQDFHMAGRSFVLKAKILEEMGNLEEALAVLREAAPLIDPEREPRLLLCVQHNLLDYFSKLGRPGEAMAMLPKVWKLSRELGNELDLIRLAWTEGLVRAGLGDTERAAEDLRAVQAELASRSMGYDAALVALDLAQIYAQGNRVEAIAELAREMIPIFEAQDIHREALAALAVFQRAALQERATVSLVGKVARYLVEARSDPGMKFEEV